MLRFLVLLAVVIRPDIAGHLYCASKPYEYTIGPVTCLYINAFLVGRLSYHSACHLHLRDISDRSWSNHIRSQNSLYSLFQIPSVYSSANADIVANPTYLKNKVSLKTPKTPIAASTNPQVPVFGCASFFVRGGIGDLDIGKFFLADGLEGVCI